MYKKIEFEIRGDNRGELIAIEGCMDVPFEIKRFYYIYGTRKEAIRGKHAHRILKQVIFPIEGSCSCLLSDGYRWERVELDKKGCGIYIDTMVWRELINFSDSCIVGVLASDHYKEEDYIRDHEEFLREARR